MSRADYERALATPEYRERYLLEQALGRRLAWWPRFHLRGFCQVCDRPVRFLVDRRHGGVKRDGVWQPQWRNRQVCSSCRLISRHRFVYRQIETNLARTCSERPSVYLTEQTTRLARTCARRLTGAELVGSEYLGPDVGPGRERDGVRNESLEQLSFADGRFDVVVTADVLEHVPEPGRALGELARVTAPGGVLLFTIPFLADHDRTTTRARQTAAGVVHLREPQVHFNPLDRRGALVYTDFGWDLLGDVRAAGFASCEALLYWSYTYGYLGIPSLLFRAVR